MSAPLAEVSVETDGDLAIVSVRGEVDLANAGEVGDAIRRGVPASNALVIDLAPVEYLDSAAIAMLDGLRAPRRAARVPREKAPDDGRAGNAAA